MNNGRWYPTLTTMSDGSVLIVSGSYRPHGTTLNNTVPQKWNASSLTEITPIPPAAWDLYPRLHIGSNKRVFSTGSLQQTWVLDVSGAAWTPGALKTANGQRDYAPSVLYDVDKVLYVDGGNLPTANADLLDLGAPQAASTAEITAYAGLLTKVTMDGATEVAVTVTGPLRPIGGENTLEVRQARLAG